MKPLQQSTTLKIIVQNQIVWPKTGTKNIQTNTSIEILIHQQALLKLFKNFRLQAPDNYIKKTYKS